MLNNVFSRYLKQGKWLLSTVTVESYEPGKIKGYSPLLHHKTFNAKTLQLFFKTFKEITEVQATANTGTFMITYKVEEARQNKFLAGIEKVLKKKIH